MSIPPNSTLRGCAAFFPQPVENQTEVEHVMNLIYRWNCNETDRPLPNIVYRSGYGQRDITCHVFRWDRRDPQQIFESGFQARPQGDTPDHIYYSLDSHVNHGGIPGSSIPPDEPHFFISTTIRGGWYPTPRFDQGQQNQEILMYRYEIYAPGGIWVNETLRNRYNFRAQEEVSFVGGIAPQYIRSAQLFRFRLQDGYVRHRRVDDNIIENHRIFRPQSHPRERIRILRPVCRGFQIFENGTRAPVELNRVNCRLEPIHKRVKHEASEDATDDDWYATAVADTVTYSVSAAFRASATNEAYLFVENEYVLLNYAPGTTDNKVINGPLPICDGFPSLTGTVFGEYGVDCVFDTDNGNEVFIFSGNLCAYIDYAPGTTDDKILKGPMAIADMFPFFDGTVFKNGVDSAFRASSRDEAYIFRENQYALINYKNPHLIALRTITEGFYSLKNTVFESGIDAAFASHRKNEAYIFKEDQCALINFAPGTTDDYIIGRVKPLLSNWPSLRCILPHKNCGFESHDHDEQHEQTPAIHNEL